MRGRLKRVRNEAGKSDAATLQVSEAPEMAEKTSNLIKSNQPRRHLSCESKESIASPLFANLSRASSPDRTVCDPLCLWQIAKRRTDYAYCLHILY